MHDDVRRRVDLRAQLGDGADEAARAERRRGAERDDVRLAPARLRSSSAAASIAGARSARDRRRSGSRRRAAGRAARSPVGRSGGEPLTTRMQRSPSFAAAAAVTRAWFDWTPPLVISVSAPRAQRVGRHELHLADLVAAERERQRVVALDEQPRAAAERAAQAVQLLDRRWRRERAGSAAGRHRRFSILSAATSALQY